MKKVLLTGCAGFIGYHTAKELFNQGYQVIGLDNLNDYYDVQLKQMRLKDLSQFDQFTFIEGDIENFALLDSLFIENPDFCAIINLAARAGVRASMDNPFIYLSTNTLGTLNLLELMRRYSIRKYIMASTSSIYAGAPMPFNEDLSVNTPISPYAASKKAAELMAYSYHYLYGIDVSIVRYFTVYGPFGRPDMCMFRFIKWIDEGTPIELFGDGSQSRDFTFVEDIAKGTVAALKAVGYEIINLGGGKRPVTINDVIATIEKYLSKKAVIENKPFHKADITETAADISKAAKLLDWAPTMDLDEGIRQTIDWYLQNKAWLMKVKI